MYYTVLQLSNTLILGFLEVAKMDCIHIVYTHFKRDISYGTPLAMPMLPLYMAFG